MDRYIERLNSDLLETARRLLLTTEKSVGDVAAEVGIPNANYFSRLFKTIWALRRCGSGPAAGTSARSRRAGADGSAAGPPCQTPVAPLSTALAYSVGDIFTRFLNTREK